MLVGEGDNGEEDTEDAIEEAVEDMAEDAAEEVLTGVALRARGGACVRERGRRGESAGIEGIYVCGVANWEPKEEARVNRFLGVLGAEAWCGVDSRKKQYGEKHQQQQ